jgi:hypothetical protein
MSIEGPRRQIKIGGHSSAAHWLCEYQDNRPVALDSNHTPPKGGTRKIDTSSGGQASPGKGKRGGPIEVLVQLLTQGAMEENKQGSQASRYAW